MSDMMEFVFFKKIILVVVRGMVLKHRLEGGNVMKKLKDSEAWQ